MSEQTIYRPPSAVVKELGISPATLRRWSDEFASYLSAEAGPSNGRTHRRYNDDDIATLMIIKELMNDGLTYEQVRQQLADQVTISTGYTPISPEQITGDSEEDDLEAFDAFEEADEEQFEPDQAKAMITSGGGVESPAISFLTNTLTALSDNQKSILNSQAANRELLGVLIQDNFNLKEENNRLRERVLEVERSMAQRHREEELQREALRQELDAKLMAVQQLATEAITAAHSVETPDIKAVNTKPGCLGALFGGGETQIVAVPRRSRDGRGVGQSISPDVAASPLQSSLPPQRPAVHPKPTSPPE